MEVGEEMKRIKRNRIQCKVCGDIIESVYTHDFKSCSCGRCCIDGGLEYIRREADDLENIIEMVEYEKNEHKEK